MADFEINLSIAGLTLRVLDESQAMYDWLSTRWTPFHAAGPLKSTPSLTVAIRRSTKVHSWQEQLRVVPGDEPGGFRMEGFHFIMSRRRCGLPFEVEARPNRGDMAILRWAFAAALLEHSGILMHAASCILDGRGVAFAGPSGVGKTTLSRILQSQSYLLSDETTALRFEGSMPLIYSTPFAGELGAISGNVSAPLDAIYFLRHDSENSLRPLSLGEATGRLLGAWFMPMRQEPWLSMALGLAEQVVRSVPCLELGFRPDQKIVEVIRESFTYSASAA